MPVERWPRGSPGRSRAEAYRGLVWTVASDNSERVDEQVAQALAMLEANLIQAVLAPGLRLELVAAAAAL